MCLAGWAYLTPVELDDDPHLDLTNVLFMEKNLAAVNANSLEHAVAVQQPVIVDVNGCLVFRDELASDVNLLRHAGNSGRKAAVTNADDEEIETGEH